MTYGNERPARDVHIARSPDFTRPILEHVRSIVHRACPNVDETLKWGTPSFMYHGILCGMAAFKEHCTFGFRKGTLIVTDKGKSLEAMGSFGCITKISDLPSAKVLTGYVMQAMLLNEQRVKLPVKHKPARKPLKAPAYFLAALKKNKRASAAFEKFSPSNKRDSAEWLIEAKTEEARAKRLATAIAWIAEEKIRNWKYVRK